MPSPIKLYFNVAQVITLLDRPNNILLGVMHDDFLSLKTLHCTHLANTSRKSFMLLLHFWFIGRDRIGIAREDWKDYVHAHPAAHIWLLDAGLIEKTAIKRRYIISDKGVKFCKFSISNILKTAAIAAKPNKPKANKPKIKAKRALKLMLNKAEF